MSTSDLAALRDGLAYMTPAADDGELIDRIRLLEEIKGAVAAAQATQTAAFTTSQRAEQRAAGVPQERVGRGIAAQVALAKRESPYRAQRYVGWASILVSELPGTLAQLRHGRTTEWRAMLVARETAWLSREHRREIDADLAPLLPRLGDRRVEAEAKRRAYRLDPHGYLDRLRAAETDRRVTLRPAPDVMARLGALLPAPQGVAAYHALAQAADAARVAGDPRSRGQVMADTLVERVTGQAVAAGTSVEVNLVMTDASLLGVATRKRADGRGETPADQSQLTSADGSLRNEPAELLGYGPVPAPWARALLQRLPTSTPAWIRRLYRDPRSGELVAMDSHRREFRPGQRRFVRIRDHDICRTPWCDAPVRHTDHIVPAARGGPTSVVNAAGLCEACNYAKQALGWSAATDARGGAVTITTPTGHTYSHAPPGLPGEEHGRAERPAA